MKANAYKFHNPVATVFGRNAAEALPSLVGDRKVMLLTFPEADAIGLTRRITKILGKSVVGIEDGTEPNPDVIGIARLYKRFWSDYRRSDVIIAMGGGSTLDTAKNLMVGTASGEYAELLDHLVSGSPFTPSQSKPLIAIPTTAGTGSEVTPWASVWDHATKKKYSLHLKETWAEAAVVDPELMLTLPASVTLQSGLDALSHALESIWNVNANPVSDTFAVSAAREMMAVLPDLMEDLGNITLRTNASLSALKAGLAFSNTKTALAHSISYDMTLRHGLPHGIACSFTLPMVLKLATGRNAERDKILQQIFPYGLDEAPTHLSRFLESLGVSTAFEDYGVSDTESREMIADALNGTRGKNFIGAATA